MANHIVSQLRFILHGDYNSLTKCWLLYNFSAKPASLSHLWTLSFGKGYFVHSIYPTLTHQNVMADLCRFFFLWLTHFLPLSLILGERTIDRQSLQWPSFLPTKRGTKRSHKGKTALSEDTTWTGGVGGDALENREQKGKRVRKIHWPRQGENGEGNPTEYRLDWVLILTMCLLHFFYKSRNNIGMRWKSKATMSDDRERDRGGNIINLKSISWALTF